jgi:hypothetical protein
MFIEILFHAMFITFVNYDRKKIYNIGPWSCPNSVRTAKTRNTLLGSTTATGQGILTERKG